MRLKLPVPPKVNGSVAAKLPPPGTTTEPALTVSTPVFVFAAVLLKVSVPAPFLVIALVVFRVTAPVIAVLPVPPMVSVCTPALVTLASVVVAVTAGVKKLLFVLIVPRPVSVVAPKVSPAVPLVTRAPGATVNVNAPRLSVPSVCVTPAPVVSRSGVICIAAPTVALLTKVSPVSFASCSSVPAVLKVSAETPSALPTLVARRTPPVSVVVPE